MTGKKRPPESGDKGAESAKPDAEGTPMERFKGLARKIVGVPREDVEKERRAHAARDKKRHK